jgi:hypothetical protein
MSASRSWALRLGPAILLLLALLPAGASAHAVRGPVLRLSRPARIGGCCPLEIARMSAASVSVTDMETGFSAAAGPFLLSRSRLPGYVILWVWISERNETNVADALVSGPRNWLLLARDGVHNAFPAAPPRHDAKKLAHVNALVADTDPENDGWIAFRFPLHTGPRFTLFWSDCRPRCDQSDGLPAYAPVVDVTVINSR